MCNVVKWLVIGGIGLYVFNLVQNKRAALDQFQVQSVTHVSPRPTPPTRPAAASQSSTRTRAASADYECNGRQHCSQMRSCAEARWVLKHCPNTKMDGDGDNVPCEDQLCGH